MKSDQTRAFLAVLISGVILFGWSHFFGPKEQPVAPGTKVVTKSAEAGMAKEGLSSDGNRQIVDNVQSPPLEEAERPESERPARQEITLKNGTAEIVLNNRINIVSYSSELASEDFSKVVGGEKTLSFLIDNETNYNELFFDFQNVAGDRATGIDSRNGVKIDLELLSDGTLGYTLSTQNPRKFRVQMFSKEYKENASGSFFTDFLAGSANQNNQRRFVLLHKEFDEFTIPTDDEGENSLKWLGIDAFYHLFAVTFEDSISMSYKTTEAGFFRASTNNKASVLNGRIVFTKKYYETLKGLGDKLDLALDFGFFSVISIPLFKGLQFLHTVIPNWGFAIILLTLFIRFVTFPLYLKQMKSMNKMKKIQPEINKIKEKYKDDSQKQQRETMELFKRHGVNPVGGCLPIFLQMPIFFAFYKVLTVTAELDQEGFLGWIGNLTEKDPYYVLPVLVAVVMFANQKLMPQTTTDPNAQRMMTVMPIVFGFFFINMPAGLNLYILVSTLFGIGQQIFVNKRVEA